MSLADQFTEDANAGSGQPQKAPTPVPAGNAGQASLAAQFAADAAAAPQAALSQAAPEAPPTGWTQMPDGTLVNTGAQGMQPGTGAPMRVEVGGTADQNGGGQPNALLSALAGLGHGVGETALGAQQMLGHGLQYLGADLAGNWLVNDANSGLQKIDSEFQPYQQAHGFAAGAGNIGGDMAAMMIPGGALARGMGAAGVTGALVNGAAQGALGGVLTPVRDGGDFGTNKLAQVGAGAGTGAILGPATQALARAIQGFGGASQQTLNQAGVTMTPGQILGGGFKATEDKLTSVPVVGDIIRNAQGRALESYNRAAYNDALAPLGKTYTGTVGNEGIDSVRSTISQAYNKILPQMQFSANDPGFASDMQKISSMVQSIPEAQQNQFNNIVNNQIYGKSANPQGIMDGKTLKGVQTELRNAISGYGSDPSYDARQLGAALGAVKDSMDASIARTNPPELANALQAADASWAKFTRLRTAAASAGANNANGVFTAAQLNSAVRNADTSVGKGATATGNALMQDFSQAGQNVLGAKYPDSGTAGRSLLTLGAGTLLGGATIPTAAIPIGLAAGAVSLPYTSAGQRMAQALLMNRPGFAKPLANSVSKWGALAAPALGNALLNYSP